MLLILFFSLFFKLAMQIQNLIKIQVDNLNETEIEIEIETETGIMI